MRKVSTEKELRCRRRQQQEITGLCLTNWAIFSSQKATGHIPLWLSFMAVSGEKRISAIGLLRWLKI